MSKSATINNILVTGNCGYIGSVLVPELIDRGYAVTGLDTNFYGDTCRLIPERKLPIRQIYKDVRDVVDADLRGFDAVIHLAALSNDPLGELDQKLTDDINYRATVSIAEFAKKAGVERFIYSSSQSMYGISNTDDELDEDTSEKNPLTAYARTKWLAECDLKQLHSDSFMVVCFRPSTVFGASPKLRSDIVYNNLVGCAYTTGKIEIKSDGTPWRPVVHILDVINAFIAGLEAPAELVANQSFNVGIPNGNFSVRELAEAAQGAVAGSTLTFTGEHGSDARTYRVSFKKILTVLKDYFKPSWNLARGGTELASFYKTISFTEQQFRGLETNRLPCLKQLLATGQIDSNLRWK